MFGSVWPVGVVVPGLVVCQAPPQPAEELVGQGHCQLEQSEGDFRRFASAIYQVACDV